MTKAQIDLLNGFGNEGVMFMELIKTIESSVTLLSGKLDSINENLDKVNENLKSLKDDSE